MSTLPIQDRLARAKRSLRTALRLALQTDLAVLDPQHFAAASVVPKLPRIRIIVRRTVERIERWKRHHRRQWRYWMLTRAARQLTRLAFGVALSTSHMPIAAHIAVGILGTIFTDHDSILAELPTGAQGAEAGDAAEITLSNNVPHGVAPVVVALEWLFLRRLTIWTRRPDVRGELFGEARRLACLL